MNLGNMHSLGLGVLQSYGLAAEWYKKPAAMGMKQAQAALAALHEHGLGVAKDYQEARRLNALASAQGDQDSTKALKELDEKIRNECPLLGKRVMITGTSREDLNGRVGVARSFDEANEARYVVSLVARAGAIEPALRIKPENLEIA